MGIDLSKALTRGAASFLLILAFGGGAPRMAVGAEGEDMSGSRYMGGMAYNPALRTAAYGGLRGRSSNALAPLYGMGPGVGFGAPSGAPGGMAMPAPSAALSGGASGGMLTGGAPAELPREDGGQDFAANEASREDTLGRGAESTGDPIEDAMLAAPVLAPAAFSMIGGPTGLLGLGLGAAVAGGLRAFGREDLARQVFNASFGSPITGGPYADLGNPTNGEPTGPNLGAGGAGSGGNLAEPGTTTDPNTAQGALSGSMASGMNYGVPTPAEIAADQTGNLANQYGAGLSGDSSVFDNGGFGNPSFSGGYTEGNFGGSANPEGANLGGGGFTDAASAPSAGMGSSASETDGFRKGGYTGHGGDGRVDPYNEAGPVHEGEYVLRHEATRHYGPEVLAALNSGAIPRNALMALMPQRRPMQAANHLVQMMMARG